MTDRDASGKFVKGAASPNPKGRPPKEISESVTALIDSVVSPDDWAKIVTKLRDMALRGNLPAINALFDRRFGKPTERKEVTGADGNELLIRILDADDTAIN